MANALYGLGRQSILEGGIAWLTDNIKAVLVDNALYVGDPTGTPANIDIHDFLDDIAAGARIATSGNLAGKSSTLGVADATDVTFTAVTGASVEAIVIYKDTGAAATSNLIAYIDTATNLPVTPNGGDITVQWDAGANKIFKL